jgi:hypothetical protein
VTAALLRENQALPPSLSLSCLPPRCDVYLIPLAYRPHPHPTQAPALFSVPPTPFTPLHHVPSRRAAAYISATNHPLPPHLYFAPTTLPLPPLQHHTCFRKPEHYEALLQLCTIRNPARTPQTPPFLYISFFKQHQHEYRYTTYTLAARAL